MNLQTYLQQHQVSQAQFAKRLGVSQGLVWQWVNGKTALTVDRVKQIAVETGHEVTPHELMPDVFPSGFVFADEPSPAERYGAIGRGSCPNCNPVEDAEGIAWRQGR